MHVLPIKILMIFNIFSVDIIGVTETRITNNYSYEFTPTETTAGCTLL